MIHTTLETYTHDQLEAFTHDELETIYFSDAFAIADAAPVMAVGKSLVDAMELDTPYLSVSDISQGATEATLTTESGADVGFSDGEAVVVFDGTGFDKHGYVDGVPASTSIDVDDGAGAAVADVEKVGVSIYCDDTYYANGGNILNIATDDFEIDCWFKQDGLPAAQDVLVGKASFVGDVGWALAMVAGGDIRLRADDGTNDAEFNYDITQFLDNKWHHLYLFADRSNISNCEIWMDGIQKVVDTIGTFPVLTLANSDNMVVSALLPFVTPQNVFEGSIRDVRIKIGGTKATAAQILYRAMHAFDYTVSSWTLDGIREYWEFSEKTGTTITAGVTTPANDLTLSNVAAWSQEAFVVRNKVVLSVGKNIIESMSFSETFVKDIGLPFTEALSISESPAFDFYKVLCDTQTIIETFIAGNRLFFSELFNISDSISFGQTYGRAFGESMAIVDSVVFLSGKNIRDVIAIVDALASVSSISKSLTDTMSIVDVALVSSVSKVLSDILSSGESIYTSLELGQQLASQKDIAGLLADPRSEVRPWMPWVAIGASNIESDELYETALWEELHRKRGDVSVTANTYFVRATFGQDEPTSDDLVIREIGIFDAASGGVMGKRWVLNTGVEKDNVDEIVIECAVTILHGEIQAIKSLFNLGPDEESEDETENPKDIQPIADTISFKLTKALNFNDNMPISDVITSKDISKQLFDNEPVSDSFSRVWSAKKSFAENLPIDEVFSSSLVPTAPADFLFLNASINVVDITNKANPSIDSTFGYARYEMVAEGDYLYVGGPAGFALTIYDVTDPTSPVNVGSVVAIDSNCLATTLLKSGNVLYCGIRKYDDGGGDEIGGVMIINIADPTNPTILAFHESAESTWVVSGITTQGLAVSGDYLFTAQRREIETLDISNLASPSLVGYHAKPAAVQSLVYTASRAYVADGGRYLWVMDITDKANHKRLSRTIVDCADLVQLGNKLYIAAGSDGFAIVEIVGDTLNVIFTDNTPVSASAIIYSAAHERFFLADKSNPGGIFVYNAAGTETGYFGGVTANKLSIYGDRLYYTDLAGGFNIVDITDPDNSVLEKLGPATEGAPIGIVALDNIVYVLSGRSPIAGFKGWEVFDTDLSYGNTIRRVCEVAAPVDPGFINRYGYDIRIVDDRLYIADAWSVLVYDLDDIDIPVLLAEYEEEAATRQIRVDENGRYIYMAGSGFVIASYNGTPTAVIVPTSVITSNAPVVGTSTVTLTLTDIGINASDWDWSNSSPGHVPSDSGADGTSSWWVEWTIDPDDEDDEEFDATITLRSRNAAGVRSDQITAHIIIHPAP